MKNLNKQSFESALKNGTGFCLGKCPEVVKEKWEIFARKYDRVADAIRNLAKCDGKWIDYRASYTMIEACASKDLILFPYDSDTFENFQESYQELEQLHNMLDFPEITMTVEVFLFFVIFEVNL